MYLVAVRLATIALASLAALTPLLRADEPPQTFETLVRAFSVARYNLAQELSARLDLPLPSDAHAFFSAAATGAWDVVSNRFEQLMLPNSQTARPAFQNELWAPIHETLGIWEVWAGWKQDSSLLALFYEPILSSLPTHSIYFGGTDYGRFVITTVNALKTPPTVFCITQNQLADMTYADHLRAFYGTRIWLPSQEDCTRAFADFVKAVQQGQHASADVQYRGGRVTVTGVGGVMAINGLIARMIFEHNKATHPFFVEESYVIDWMYPYLEPYGLIMKLHPEPLIALPEESVARDRTFWADYEQRLTAYPGFGENPEARKAFAKLRTALASLYAYRAMYDEAESAFRQALRLYPSSPEANLRLAKMLDGQHRAGDARQVLETYLATDPQDAREEAEQELQRLSETPPRAL